MGVRRQCEAHVAVPQHTGYRLHIDSLLQSQGSEAISRTPARIFQDLLMQLRHQIRVPGYQEAGKDS